MKSIKPKGLIFISDVEKALEHEWFVDAVDKNKFNLEFVLFNSKNSKLFNYIKKSGFKCKNYGLKTKYFIPFYVLFFIIKMVFKRYNFVHCHLFEASLMGLISAKIAGVKKRIYTRHHSDFHHTYFPNAVKYDLLNNKLSTHIIAVSNIIKTILISKENVDSQKITVIPHGIPLTIFDTPFNNDDINKIKQKYSFESNWPVIGVISRFTEWKGVHYIIPAFKQLLVSFPNAKLILANAMGDYESKIKEILLQLPITSYTLIPFENDVIPLFKSFDVFVHVPVNKTYEAFGQVYIEAMCFEVPMVCTLSGIANDYIVNEKNALVVDYKNSEQITKSIIKILTDGDLKNKIVNQAKLDVKEYNFEIKFEKIITLYTCNP